MDSTIDFRELTARFEDLLAHAAAGDEVVVTDRGRPLAILKPLPRPKPRMPGLHPGSMQPAPDFDAPLLDDFWTGQA